MKIDDIIKKITFKTVCPHCGKAFNIDFDRIVFKDVGFTHECPKCKTKVSMNLKIDRLQITTNIV